MTLVYLNEKCQDPASNKPFNMAMFLEPQFKATCLSHEEVKELEEKTATDASSTSGQSEMEESTAPSAKTPKNSLASFFKECYSAPRKQQGIDVELDSYLLMVSLIHGSGGVNIVPTSSASAACQRTTCVFWPQAHPLSMHSVQRAL